MLQVVNTAPHRRRAGKKPDLYPRPGIRRRRGTPFRQANPEAQKLLAYMREHQGAMPEGQWRDVAELPKAQ